MDKPRLNLWQIGNMNFGFLGIPFGWGLQLANMSAIYAKLGAATTPTQYINEASSANLQQSLNQVNQAYANLGTALGQ